MSKDGRRSFFTGFGHSEDLTADQGRTAPFDHLSIPISATVVCSRCNRTTKVGTMDAARRLLAASVWIPGRAFNRRLRCPACHRRAWVRVHLERETS